MSPNQSFGILMDGSHLEQLSYDVLIVMLLDWRHSEDSLINIKIIWKQFWLMKEAFNHGKVYWFHIVKHEDSLFYYVIYHCKWKNLLV